MSLLAFAVSVRVKALALAMRAMWPDEVTDEVAMEHATAAVNAETSDVHAELLLAIAYGESRFDSRATSRVINGERITGVYASTKKPTGLGPSLFCGATQAIAQTWAQCMELRDPSKAYAQTVTELQTWLADKRVKGDLTVAIAGYQGGNAAVVGRRIYPAKRVQLRAQAINHEIWKLANGSKIK